ncbi:hypothetical protein [Nocardia puris]|uniref:hypothetical protein n=1 Tax=Nocardia puris TaxID=208602 RepID=UPI001E5CF16F|nr:hypothetical protein [Nocardia puris]
MNPMPRRRLATALTALLLGLAASGCGGGTDDDAAQPDPATSAESTSPAAPSEVQAPLGDPVTPDPTIVDPRPIPFTTWARVADDRIAVNFQMGAPECFGIDATTTETDEAVTVALRSGTRADGVGKMCVMIAVFATLEIPLDRPLGDRAVLSATEG